MPRHIDDRKHREKNEHKNPPMTPHGNQNIFSEIETTADEANKPNHRSKKTTFFPWIIVTSAHSPQRRVILNEFATSIGRGISNKVPLNDPRASRRHGEFLHESISTEEIFPKIIYRDCGSRNGSFLNGDLVIGHRRLEHGDSIVIGDNIINFFYGSRQKPILGEELQGAIKSFSESNQRKDGTQMPVNFHSKLVVLRSPEGHDREQLVSSGLATNVSISGALFTGLFSAQIISQLSSKYDSNLFLTPIFPKKMYREDIHLPVSVEWIEAESGDSECVACCQLRFYQENPSSLNSLIQLIKENKIKI